MLIFIFISLECFINNRYIHLLSVNFFYKQANNFQNARKKYFLLYYLNNTLIIYLFLLLNF